MTPTVVSELQRHAPLFTASNIPPWLKLCQPSLAAIQHALQWVSARMLDPGEAEALAFALETKADMFLTDDDAARTFGESLGLQARGSLGVILYGAATGHLDQTACSQLLRNLEERSTLWMSSKVKSAAHSAMVQIFGGK